MTVPAHEVAAVLRQRLPEIGRKKLHKLLYYVQGHHLAMVGEPVFDEIIVAYDMGPVVEKLWQEETHGLAPGPHEPAWRPLSEAELNTIGYVLSRYGSMTGSDLQRLSHQEPPLQQANAVRRRGGHKSATIEVSWMLDYFSAQQSSDDDVALPAGTFAQLGRDVTSPSARRRRPDTRESLHAQLRRYAGDRARFANLWFGAVPGTRHDRNLVVTWSYWVEESRHALVAEFISTLSEPIHPPR